MKPARGCPTVELQFIGHQCRPIPAERALNISMQLQVMYERRLLVAASSANGKWFPVRLVDFSKCTYGHIFGFPSQSHLQVLQCV